MKRTIIIVLVFVSFVLLSGCNRLEYDRLATQRAIANSNAAIETAKSDQRIAESEASVANYRTLADAAKPDNTLLMLMLIGMFGVAGMLIYWHGKTTQTNAQTMQAVIMAQLPQQVYRASLEPPIAVLIAARHWRGEPVFDGECWAIVDGQGCEIVRERKQLRG